MTREAGLKWAQIGVCLCLLMGGGAQEDPLTQPITYDRPAQTVKQLLEALSRQTSVRLFAPSPIDTEIVLVSVREMPLKELMDYLAAVTDGEWFKQPNGSYHLVRTPKITRERRQQDDEQILQGLQRALKKKEIKPLLEPLTEQGARQHRDKIKELMREVEAQDINQPLWRTPYARSIYEQLELLLAGKRLVARLIQQMDLRRLLEVPVGERRVFSNVRGRFLLPLGFEVQPLLRQYVQESQLVYQAWNHPTEGLDAQRVQQFNDQYNHVIYDEWLRQKPMSKPPTRVYLVVHRQSPDLFSCSVSLATDDLKESRGDEGSFLSLWAQSEEEAEEEGAEKAQGQQAPGTPSQPPVKVEWSERSRQFMETYQAMEQSTEPVPWSPILDPSQIEPLSLIPSEVLRAY
ncbi:MAG: hypothetical protein NZL85_09000, partial [Fimbriimonadales bacterium]|nr:hypothetical protein [Fimbriimonadales bacterium]